ncbi:KpsF/GutQ family sugar-phosphate isomerase [Pokkaliibacter sp. MBI-7]|uniref:KpsF/GutQ family sugar-phosphate isomerase n=1 Tax=Pokkaliibacter sp. MBI-7 TaxID=3040600 RepID=UPI00244BE75A|nr:KpsF/GutQ family sugar-phosphate isomerase [Pokkaliibacter sp. MBI-7]MDH2431660.1 KpsF/GutQ family sugar-phosphate isomerase [Pokkaliibacter sp. MBI-7]
MSHPHDFLASAQRTIRIEADAVASLQQQLGEHFNAACQLMLSCTGRVVVIGMGKSGHIGNKIAATLASTGTPSFFVHPAEASHGDMGMITTADVVLALSNSGETPEVLNLIPLLKRLRIPLISMTGNASSSLATAADVHITLSIDEEACPLGLAPTSSTTVALVMGDALAVALLEARGFTAEDFAFSHPGGSLGRRLLLRARDLMHGDEQLPQVSPDTLLRDSLLEITRKGLGLTTVTDESGQLCGIFTDGDLRRALDQRLDLHSLPISDVMTRGCKTINPELLAAEALNLMEQWSITALVVVEQNKPVGILHMHDLIKAGVV